MSAQVATFTLRHPGTCTGMFWRSCKSRPHSLPPPTADAPTPPWPRNGALLRGIVHTLPEEEEHNTKWLEVLEYRQAGPGAWMIFDQGGLLLHDS